MRPNVKVRIDGGAVKRAAALLRRREKVEPHRVTVGVHEAEGAQAKRGYDGRDSGITLAQDAAIHEFGAGAVPDRSWLRSWVDANRDRISREMVRAMRAEFRGDRDEMHRQAEAWRDELRAWIAEQEGHLAPLSPETVERKQAAGLARPDVPLYATGQLVEAIRAEVDA